MNRKRLSTALVAVCAAALAAAPAAWGRDATVTSFDGTAIALHFFPAAGLAPGAKAPTVLFGPGWGSGGDTNDESATDTGTGIVGVGPLRNAGYNVLTWDPRGFGSSGGTVEVDSPDFEARDVSALIDYVARQPEAQLDAPGDPRVGMSGGSYGGGIQLVTAAIDPRVDVIVPDIAWHSLVSSQYKEGTVKSGWGAILYGLGVEGSHNRLDPAITDAFTQGIATGTFSQQVVDFFASRGPAGLLDRIHVPTFLMQGTVDTLFSLQEAIDNYDALSRNGIPLKMLWFCGGHGACLTSPGDLGLMQREELAWLARYLKRDRSVDTGPGFEWVDQDGAEHTAASYPLPAGAPLVGDGSGTLPLVQPGGSGPAVYTNSSNPTGVLGAAVAPTKAANAVDVTVRGPATAEPMIGAPRVTLTYVGSGSSTTTTTKVFAQVLDDATGSVLNNQITPIPVTLDGLQHTVTQPLEVLSAEAHPGATYTLQLVASSTAYDVQRSAGTVAFSKIHVELPTAATGAVLAAGARACTSRRSLTVHVRRRYRHRLLRARVLVDGRLVRRLGRHAAAVRIDLRGRRGGRVTVRIVMRLRSGRTVVDTRRYRLCSARR
ncbi:MAG TPA: CocE/NonD family hydrolase [Solirubrobacteraceae bacterium]|nr:CocE/NonD family hydrolase [Solirubrobacteraceae bacterium]